jgi:large repetitive protein
MEKNKKRGMSEMKGLMIILAIAVTLAIMINTTEAITRTNNATTGYNLSIWDTSEASSFFSNDNITFYANYTNITGAVVADTCSIRFNFTGTNGNYINMTYNSTILPYYYNRSFTYKGNHTFEVWCYNATAQSILQQNFFIGNTPPIIAKERPELGLDWINFDGVSNTHDVWGCIEDTLCTYNMTRNITEPDTNDNLTFSLGSNSSVNTSIYSINTTTGLLTVNATASWHAGTNLQIQLNVHDTESPDRFGILALNITAVNDAPLFQNLVNMSINATNPGNNLTTVIYAVDEEAHLPLTFNLTFSHCTPANWSSRNTGPNCTIWNSTDYNLTYNSTALYINFTSRGRDDAGVYYINFSVSDNATGFGFARNAQTNYSINFTVDNVNVAPNLTSICNIPLTGTTTYINATEGTLFSCIINATDLDELSTLTFASNETWFFNNTNGTYGVFNASLQVNLTATDLQVGNYSINISVFDNDTVFRKWDSRIITLQIFNINDSVLILPQLNDVLAFTGNTYAIYVNATDNDLLVPNKNASNGGYNETINFTATNLSGTTLQWITITRVGDSANLSQVSLNFEANSTTVAFGNVTVNLSVIDQNGHSQASRLFNINLSGNSAPVWNASFQIYYNLTEGTTHTNNLTLNVSDADGNQINFTYRNSGGTNFPGFFNVTNISGYLSFTPTDADIGNHSVTINATDGRTATPINVNYTVLNVNDAPVLGTLSSMTVSEDSQQAAVAINVYDEDLKIFQKSFYTENITLNFTIDGPNTQLFNITISSIPGPTSSQANLTIYTTTAFTPNKSDLGGSQQRVYTVYVQATDQTGAIDTDTFTVTINSINHNPNISSIANQSTYQGANFSLQINVTDLEDTSTDAGGTFNFTYQFMTGTNFSNLTTFNRTSGRINFTVNSTIAGSYRINVSVNDTSNLGASDDFWINVYDRPYFIAFNPTNIYTSENSTIIINITANHSIGDNLNYSVMIDGVVRNSTMGAGNGASNISLSIKLNFTDETTCSGVKNLTINISNTYFSNTTNINLSVNFTNNPVNFASTIPNSTAGGSVSLTLSDYFTDPDVDANTCSNHTVIFTYLVMNSTFSSMNTAFTISVTNWTNSSGNKPKFNVSTSTDSATEYYQIIANDTYTISKSNNFSITLTPSTVTVETPSSGGGIGGGGGATRPVSLKLLFPDKISAFKNDEIIVPITLLNSGSTTLNGIKLRALLAKNETISEDVTIKWSEDAFTTLSSGQRRNTNLTIGISTKKTGKIEILVNATVTNPSFSDWGKFFIDIVETNKTEVEQIILFTDELIIENPECAELKESLDRARDALVRGNVDEAWQYSNEVVRSCRNAISQRPSIVNNEGPSRGLIVYTIIGALAILFLVFMYHIWSRMRLKRSTGY